jgi:hypothetical protein
LLATAAGLTALLLAAATLAPDPRGHGTHEQLGLPPCTYYLVFGRPCPSCGMTTAWAWLAHGQPAEAFRVNAGGTLLAIVAALSVPWLLAAAALGRRPRWTPNRTMNTWLGVAIGLITLIQWGWRLLGW